MQETERSLLEALRELESAARAPGSAPGGILPLVERVDRLAAELSKSAPPDLRHYLTRKSYEKARAFLEERDAASRG